MEIKDIDVTRYYCGPLDKAEVLMELYNNYICVGHRPLTIDQARYLIGMHTPYSRDIAGNFVEAHIITIDNINGQKVKIQFIDDCIDLTCLGLGHKEINSAVRLLEGKKCLKSPGYEVAFNIVMSQKDILGGQR